MPTAPTTTYTRQGLVPIYIPGAHPVQLAFNIPASTTLTKGTIVGELTATPGTVDAYDANASNGTQIPKGALAYDVISDAAGLITFGTAVGTQFGETALTAPVFVSGYFKTPDLNGLDANALTAAKWHLISGILTDGVVQFG